ncbi:hypothetical protein GP486_006572 [Trichoglossum hirsutum]|uniref:Uncharacterized protein n=1 Tax=Trichoglossum hirsutum TaxID=265104 RepID=A0A9P8L7B8_9PEZI|nr:hypothetical protein GP486_006572 [Trichoglossum hirsutum]
MDRWASCQQQQPPQHPPLRPPPIPTGPPTAPPPPRPPRSDSARQRILTGQISLHGHRKLQSAPGSPTRSRAKTLKRKGALENLAQRRGKGASPDVRSPAPLQLQSRAFQECTDSRPPNTSEAEEFYRSYLHLGQTDKQRPPFTPASSHESEISTYLSTLDFPYPPTASPPQQRALTHPPPPPPQQQQQRQRQRQSPHSSCPAINTIAPTTVVHYRGASFDILNPHQSLSRPQVQTPVEHGEPHFEGPHSSAASLLSSTNDMSSNSSGAGSTSSCRQGLPHRALFQDLPTAHSSITSRSMKDRTTPSPTQLDFRPKLPIVADLPLPPQPVAVRSRSQNYEASLPSEFVITMPPQLSEEKPASTWKDRLGSAFTRRAPAVPQQLPTVNEKGSNDSPRAAPAAEPRSSTYLPPFKRASHTSQSVPHQPASTYQQDHHRTSSSAGQLSHHYYDDSSIYRNDSGGAPSGSLATSSSRGGGSVPYGLDYNEEVGAQPHGYGYYDKNAGREAGSHSEGARVQGKDGSEAATAPAKAPNRSTVGSIVKRYGDVEAGDVADFEDIGLDSDDEGNSNVRGKEASTNKGGFYANSRLQLFQLGKSFLGASVGTTNSKKDDQFVLNKEYARRLTASSQPNQPPDVPLPPGPPAGYSLRKNSNNRHTFSQGLSHHDISYGDTRNLLDISQSLARGGAANQSSGALTSGSAQASSCALGHLSDSDLNAVGLHTSGASFTAGPSGLKQTLTSPAIERVRSEHNSLGSLSNSLSSSDKSDIYRELRRQSGLSNMSGNVFILSDDEIRMAQFNPDAVGDLVPGGSQTSSSSSSSSHGRMSQKLSDVLAKRNTARSLHGGLDRDAQNPGLRIERERVNVTGKGSYTSSLQGSNYSETDSEPDPHDGFEDDNDGDWETVAESGAFSRFGTGRLDIDEDTAHAMIAEDSIADFSSKGSLNAEHFKINPFGPAGLIIKHPADPRYEHVYRLRKVTPEGRPILLPTYNFSGGSRFPNRNAMTPPLPATSPPNRYQHPTPLSPDHVHPFNSSPPEMPPRKVLSPAYGRLHSANSSVHGSDHSQSDDEKHHEHRHDVYGSGVRQYPSVGADTVNGSTENPNQRFGNSFGGMGRGGSYSFGTWMGSIGEPGPAIDSQDLPGPNGSFAKVTVLGPKANITGTPDGTGMREVGSSLAGDSSNAHWSSSPHQQGSSPAFHLGPLSNPSTPTLPEPARQFQDQQIRRQQGYYNKQIRQHLEDRKAMGLTEPAFYPALPFHGTYTRTSSDGRLSPIDSMSMSSRQAIFPERPVSYNPTPPLPHLWTAKQRQIIIDGRREKGDHQHPRKGSFDSTESYRRQRTISRAILIFCMLFPIIGWMMLLLLGYGCMDATIAYCTNGEILRLRKREKSIALAFSWAVIAVAVLGLIVAGVVVATKYH